MYPGPGAGASVHRPGRTFLPDAPGSKQQTAIASRSENSTHASSFSRRSHRVARPPTSHSRCHPHQIELPVDRLGLGLGTGAGTGTGTQTNATSGPVSSSRSSADCDRSPDRSPLFRSPLSRSPISCSSSHRNGEWLAQLWCADQWRVVVECEPHPVAAAPANRLAHGSWPGRR